MQGSVTKYRVKGSSRPKWRYRIYAGKNEEGKKLYEGKGGFDKESEAAEAMRGHLDELPAPRNTPVKTEQTLGTWLQTWLDTYAVDRCQPKTLERYRQLADYIRQGSSEVVSSLANTPLSLISHSQIETALYLLWRTKSKRRDHLSSRTIRHVGGVLSVALNKAFRLGFINANPMQRVELPSLPACDVRSLTPEEIQKLREACRGDWTFVLVEVALAIGARRGELLALQWRDVDWTTGVLTISKSLEQTAAGVRIKRPKNDKTRQCRLPHSALTAMRFLCDQQRAHRRTFGADYQDRDLIFAEPNGDYLQPDLISQVIIRRMKLAGIPDASLHTLRHTHASNLLSRGVPLPAVSARLGHSDAHTTARVYSHALPADDQRAADVWDSIITGNVQ